MIYFKNKKVTPTHTTQKKKKNPLWILRKITQYVLGFLIIENACLDGKVFGRRLVKASRHTAVLCWVDKGSRAKEVMQEITGQSVTLLTG